MLITIGEKSEPKGLRYKLHSAPVWVFVLTAALSSAIVYTCMYAFRKPFTASGYKDVLILGLSYKVVLVISQVLGYMLGKFLGIRFIATVLPQKRAKMIIILIILAWIALFFFAIIPPPYNFICMFFNGLPLAMIWGLVFSYLEGRKVTELLGAVLTTSLIFASGFVKTIGKWLMVDCNINEWWMPFFAGAIFIIPLFISTWVLNQTPPQTASDIEQRTVRNPMSKDERKAFIKNFASALIPIIIAYVMLTILRDFSEDFSNELWTQIGYGGNPDIFAQTSSIIAVTVLIVVAGFYFIKNSYRAFQMNHSIILLGFSITITATILFHFNIITPLIWMVSATGGLYLGYVPYNCFYFERMLAAYKVPGNVGFVMYISDSFGYLGTVLVLIIKEIIHLEYSWVSFFIFMFMAASVIGIILVLFGRVLFERIYKKTILIKNK